MKKHHVRSSAQNNAPPKFLCRMARNGDVLIKTGFHKDNVFVVTNTPYPPTIRRSRRLLLLFVGRKGYGD